MLVLLKLGGSLITVKDQPRTLRAEVLARLMDEIAQARAAQPELQLVLGHGSGSFGHVEATRYGTRAGVRTPDDWVGLAEVQAAAAQLNRLVIDAARQAGLPVLNLPPSASTVCRDGAIAALAIGPLRAAVENGLIPVVFGDVAVDEVRGGTIISTEAIFSYIAGWLPPRRVLLAGIEPGVLTRWPAGEVLPVVTPGTPLSAVGGSHAADVTGGMANKVQEMLALAQALPGLEVRIFSGVEPGAVQSALLGERLGTAVRADA